MAFKVLIRGGIYLIFIVGVAFKWIVTQMDKQKKRDLLNDSESEENWLIKVDDPITQHTSREWRIRLSSLQMLAENPNSQNIPTLIEHLSDEVYDVREAAVSALIAHGEEAIPPTIEVLEGGRLEAREMSVQVLAGLPTKLAISALGRALLQDESSWIRMPAAEALGNISDKATVPTLISALDDPHHDVYSAVVVALNQIGTLEGMQAIADNPYTDK